MLGVNVNAGDLKVSFNVNLTQDDGKESQEPKERKHPLTSRGECSNLAMMIYFVDLFEFCKL